jgi:DNA-binding MarR family transcriptional regulator
VLARHGDVLTVRSRHLTWDGYRLGLSQPQAEKVAHAVGGQSFLPDVVPGDRVSMHWDWTCDRLSDHQVATLRAATLYQIEATNRRLAPPAVRPDPVSKPASSVASCASRRRGNAADNDADWLAAHLRSMVTARPSCWAGSDVTLQQLSAMHLISANAPVTLSILAKFLGTKAPATSAMVERLIRAGLVCRVRDQHDKRRILLSLTRNGERMIGKTDPATATRLQRTLNGMSPAAMQCLTQVLRDVAGRLAR